MERPSKVLNSDACDIESEERHCAVLMESSSRTRHNSGTAPDLTGCNTAKTASLTV
jgi:hypothetical protein